jgi:hypothetical protein
MPDLDTIVEVTILAEGFIGGSVLATYLTQKAGDLLGKAIIKDAERKRAALRIIWGDINYWYNQLRGGRISHLDSGNPELPYVPNQLEPPQEDTYK